VVAEQVTVAEVVPVKGLGMERHLDLGRNLKVVKNKRRK